VDVFARMGLPSREVRDLAYANLLGQITADTAIHAKVLVDGASIWRNAFRRANKHLGATDNHGDWLFRYLELHWEHSYPYTPKWFLDHVEVMSDPTQAEIDAAWKVESASTEAGQAHFYGDGSPQEFLERLVREQKEERH
jgi:hypothetical protein